MEEQYLTEKHYVVCDKGVAPKQLKVTSQTTTKMSGHLAATEKDTLLDNNFICVGSMMFIAGAAAGVCACIPGPGWIVAAAIAAALIAVAVIGYFKCKAAATSRVWTQQSPVLEIHGKKALLLSSIMMCPAEGGTITPKETFWAAWKSQSLTNLGHIANFAFGFLAGRGAGAIAGEGIAAGMAVEAGGMAAVRTGLQTAGRSFLNAARTELVESFTFKGWKNAGTFCKIMRGLGVGGAYYEQYNIWTSDKDVVDKLKDSSVGLIMSIFAGKGASLVCFPEGTKVHTDNGLQNIEDLQVGDLVLTYNEETLEQEYKPILVKHERYTMQMMALELPTGEVLEVTPEHRFYHNGEWIEASRLQIGDLLHLKNGDYTTIINIENFPKYQKVYNFDVEGNENYYVTEDGILVHNGYKDELPSRNNVAQGDAGAYQSRTVGDTEYQISGGGKSVWADGVDDVSNLAQDAKYVGNASRSPFIGDSNIPPFIRDKIMTNLNDEFSRYSSVINDPSNPIKGLEVITNNPKAVSTFESLMNSHNIPGKVTLIP